ncbi:Oidioi.mRNA.OKI2018_I69.chr1.g2175.t1.cds [Oikopleura dioica]|uniref:Oidioi.mRNA.OKI2018_I69.chr1.g2175.t1.cds n=1 Tax=Oikopleura dioica TaxID=34765 RepID=A0ABN7SQV2_OIKDI|nr:Oidioi.mRNA.OKI2018_I69.chr1.g2175.t1.cds [Oikopleura dioica]
MGMVNVQVKCKPLFSEDTSLMLILGSITNEYLLYRKHWKQDVKSSFGLIPISTRKCINTILQLPGKPVKSERRECSSTLKLIMESIADFLEPSRKVVNVGGGLAINYEKKAQGYPTPQEYTECFNNFGEDYTLIFEPGRSLVGSTACCIGRSLGVKNDNILVTNMSMTECIRPALYQAYHQVTLAKKTDKNDAKIYKVVGPVCESADFLNKTAQLPSEINTNQLVILWDVGAYCHVLSSNYNMRPRRAEFLVTGCEFRQIRRQDTFEDMMATFC